MLCIMTPSFLDGLRKLAKTDSDRVCKAIDLLDRDPRHPSVRLKKMQDSSLYELRATDDVRCIAVKKDGQLAFYHVGHHDGALDTARRSERGYLATQARKIPKIELGNLPKTAPAEPDAEAVRSLAPAAGFTTPAMSDYTAWDKLIEYLSDNGAELVEVRPESLSALDAEERTWLERLQRFRTKYALFDDVETLEQFERRFGADRIFNIAELLPDDDLISTSQRPKFRVRSYQALKDFIDEKVAALPYNLPATSWAVIEREVKGPVFVRGGPGSGKTLVAVYHALDQSQRQTLLGKCRVLYLTYTNALANDARKRVTDLFGSVPENLEIGTIDKYARRVGNIHAVVYSDAYLNEFAERAVARAGTLPGLRPYTADFLRSELEEVIENRGITSLEAYLEASRQGRGTPLQRREREYIWSWREHYLDLLRAEGKRDRAMAIVDATSRAAQLGRDDRYDVVVVDEIQDLSVIEVMLFTALAKSTNEKPHVMFCGDTGQSIYRKGFRWKDAGLRIGGGNVLTLDTCERSTQEIMRFASALGAGSEEDAEPAALPLRNGLPPRVVYGFTSRQKAFEFAANHVEDAVINHHKEASKFAIISRTNRMLDMFAKYCTRSGRAFLVALQRDDHFFDRGSVKLITAHSAKGLEFDSVIVLTADDDQFPLSKDLAGTYVDEVEWLASERALLYVACTRARNVLQLLCSQSLSRFLQSAEPFARVVSATEAI